MDIESWRKIAETARATSGVVTSRSLREASVEASLAADLISEQATTLSRLGQRLDAACATLAAMAETHTVSGPIDADRERVARDELRRLRWEMQVVREAMGLRGVRAEIDRYWPVPPRLCRY